MSPSAEAAIEERWGTQIVGGSVVVQEVRSRARTEYVRLIARVGSTPCVGGRTLRQALQGPGEYSRCWFLDLTEKDCLSDDDPIFETVLQLMAVEAVKDRYAVGRVQVFAGAPVFATAWRPHAERG